jgi:hypothetical protein
MECIHIGTPPADFDCWESKTFYIHNFLELPDTYGEENVVRSPPFFCLGHKWTLNVYPGGVDGVMDGWVSIGLEFCDENEVTIDWQMDIIDSKGKSLTEYEEQTTTFSCGEISWEGYSEFIKRSRILRKATDYLVDGALAIKVRMKLSSDGYCNRITPRYLLKDRNIIFLDEETSDLAFDVKGQIVVAHKCLIKSQSEELYTMCEAFSKTKPMPITDVEPAVFKVMLATFYGKHITPEEWKAKSEALLKAAGKYGFNEVKYEAEVWYTNSLNLTVENVIDEFLNADGNNFALVREAALKFIAEHGKEITAADSFMRLYESVPLMKEVLAAVADKSKKRKRDD